MDLGLKGAAVLVTGSSSGIGRAAAVAFGNEGARVAVTYNRNQEGAEEAASAIRLAGGEALVAHFDLADPDSIKSTLDRIKHEFGALNVLVNNAAYVTNPTRLPFEELPPAEWQKMLRSSLEGIFLTVQIALPLMRTSGWGRIVNVSSTTATDGWPGLAAYGAAKSGLHGLSRSLALELGPAMFLSNVVSLGAVMTERNLQDVPPEQREQIRQRIPTRELVTPEDVAGAIVFLGSLANRQITGEVIRVTGGL